MDRQALGAPGRRRLSRAVAALVGVVAVLAAGCTDGGAPPPPPATTTTMATVPSAVGLGPLVDDLRPSRPPAQAGPRLAGVPVPTNQWWTSAVTGPWTQPLWAFPVVATAGPRGLGLGAPATVNASADAVTASPAPDWWIGGPLEGVSVVAYGEFSVTLELRRPSAPPVTAVIAQGSPIVSVSVPAGPLRIDAGTRASAAGSVLADGDTRRADRLEVVAGARTWDVGTSSPVSWQRAGNELVAVLATPVELSVAPRPQDATPGWPAAFAVAAAAGPIVSTSSSMEAAAGRGAVVQRLAWQRAKAGAGLVALLPHQMAALEPAPPAASVLGRYPTARGALTVIAASEVALHFPLRGLLVGLPSVGQPLPAAATVEADLAADTAGVGSYGHPKALGRLAALCEVAALAGPATGGGALLERCFDRLESGVRDWLTFDGAGDERWLAYEPTWGGIVAHPAEFGSQDYNDHHFHYGYLIRAAATLERFGRHGDRAWRELVDLLVDDVLGARTRPGAEEPAPSTPLPPMRVWNAYQGHSGASGFVPFGDGNNQESSSEAIQAWEAIAAWGWSTGRPDLAGEGLTRYAVESATARLYWLGEGLQRPPGYGHTTAGIVWDGKIDFATFFDARPEAVIGIQLLPFTSGSLYRAGPAAALRAGDAEAAGGGTARLWPDLFVMERAMADPEDAARAMASVTSIEAGSSTSWLQTWVSTLRALGTVRLDIHADPPVGLAFVREGRTTLVAVNPTAEARSVVFRTADGAVAGTVAVGPFASASGPAALPRG